MNIAIIPAAGSGTRLRGAIPKQFIEIAGAPILIHTIRRFDVCPEIDAICVALPEERLFDFQSAAGRFHLGKPLRLVRGGEERSQSILNALEAIGDLDPEIVAIHDAVRPFVTSDQISEVVKRAREIGAAILALPASDTIKEVRDGLIVRTLDRRHIFRAQTPQAFRYDLLLRANLEASRAALAPETVTDDALLVERLGVPIAVVPGAECNLKITTREDLLLAEKLLASISQAT